MGEKEQWMMMVMTRAKQLFEAAAQYLKSRTSPKTACSFKRIKWLLLG